MVRTSVNLAEAAAKVAHTVLIVLRRALLQSFVNVPHMRSDLRYSQRIFLPPHPKFFSLLQVAQSPRQRVAALLGVIDETCLLAAVAGCMLFQPESNVTLLGKFRAYPVSGIVSGIVHTVNVPCCVLS